MKNTDSILEEKLRQLVSSVAKIQSPIPVIKLKGDASNRSYYRVGDAPSFVVMVLPQDGVKSEEKTKGEPPRELPFVNVHRYLAQIGVRVPAILHFDQDAGLMVLEDLGDHTLGAMLHHDPSIKEQLYQRAVDLLAQTRAKAEQAIDEDCIAFSRHFDVELFDWELHHFREWGLEARYQVNLPASERELLDTLFKSLAHQLDAQSKGFTHRDYQSRNLMISGNDLVVIDFQDALLGPRQYDLVALLRDSYVELDRIFIEKMLDRYLTAYASAGGEKLDRQQFVEIFDLLTIQRKLKDAGRFEYIARVKGNPHFLPYVQPSLGYVKAAFARVKQAAPLRDLLARYVPELR